MNSLLCFCILLFPLQIHHGFNFSGSILWNTGYSNFTTFIDMNGCTHLDPGGTLKYPATLITRLCGNQSNFWVVLHNDRFHSNYIRYLQKLKTFDFTTTVQTSVQPSNSQHATPKFVLREHFNLTFIEKNKILSLGHLNKNQMELVFRKKIVGQKSDYLIMPNHGQPQYLKKDLLLNFKVFKMRISGSESKNYQHHQTTEIKFKKIKAPIVYKNVWGHLYFK